VNVRHQVRGSGIGRRVAVDLETRSRSRFAAAGGQPLAKETRICFRELVVRAAMGGHGKVPTADLLDPNLSFGPKCPVNDQARVIADLLRWSDLRVVVDDPQSRRAPS